MDFAVETVDQCVGDIPPLLQAHWEEVALYRDQIPLEPDFDRYRQIESNGALVVVTARSEGELRGYSVFLLHQHLHYKSCLVASNDVIFMDRRCRGVAGMRLIDQSERILVERKADRILWHVKPSNDWSAVLAARGYVQEEIVMGKLVGDRHGS